jgi:alanine-glyoxylate transaminase / serine-glyoxylate transaminase / serine-pyruvate transaminase
MDVHKCEGRLLLGPGPSNVPPRVLGAMSRPLVGHLDPLFLSIMNELQNLLREVFQTANPLTIPISGTGTAGMEACVCNFVEEGDSVLVGVNGVFGQRIAEMVRRNGGSPTLVEARFGEPLSETKMLEAAEKCRPRIIAVVHAETSTGVLQAIEPIRDICDRFGSLLLVDTVTSLGGHPVRVDSWGIDLCYSGTQKCVSCPPGLGPITISFKGQERLKERTTKCKSWYLDLNLVNSYWGSERTYHHTAPISMNYALLEALQIIVEEGLEHRWDRHRQNHRALVAGIEGLGLQMHVAPECRLWSLNTVTIPEGVDDAAIRSQLLDEFNLEIGGGLGELQGKVWRVGLMGENSRPEKVLYFLFALERCLKSQGFKCGQGAGVQAATELYAVS